jgi:hypothetical protein
MRDLYEKYYELNKSFPNKAGKLLQVITTQKRLIETLSKRKQEPEVKQLLISVAEGYDVSIDLLEYMKQVIQGVANDSESILEGAAIRNSVRDQSELISHFLAVHDNEVKTIRQKHELTRKN